MNAASELGTQPVRQLLFRYAMPAIIAMTAASLYNIVDSIFIGHGCGALALGGLTIAKPFMDICAAFGSLVGVGASTIVAIKLGERDYDSAGKVLGNVILLNVILSSIVMIVGLIWMDPILRAFGASDETIVPAREYMQIILGGNILTHIYFGLNNMLRSIGHPKVSMIATITAVTVNIVLDPIFIFALNMGVRGAALATIISQAIAVVWQLTIFCSPHEIVRFHRGIWHLDRKITQRTLSIGASPFLMNLAHCFVVIIINNQLVRFGGDTAIASYGVINRFIFVFCMIVMGFNQGMQPIVGFNYGAKQYQRMLKAFGITAALGSAVMTMVFLLGILTPEWMIRMFTHDTELIYFSIKPMRIVVCMMWLVGFQMVTGNFFTSIGHVSEAIFLSLTRQVLYLIPLTILLPMVFTDPINGVWWSLPISDAISGVTAAIMLIYQLRIFQKRITEQTLYNHSTPPQPD